MNLLSNVSVAVGLLFSLSASMPHINHANVEMIAIPGNCSMCEKIIESAGTVSNVARVEWDRYSKTATLTYDTTQTNKVEILKRIALAGYDTDKFPATNDAYNQLNECCQYERAHKTATVQKEVTEEQYMRQYISIAEQE